jgi:hypothetical protein
MSTTLTKPDRQRLSHDNWLAIVREQVGKLRYGMVEIIVHDSQVTQIEMTERLRLDRAATEPRGQIGATEN